MSKLKPCPTKRYWGRVQTEIDWAAIEACPNRTPDPRVVRLVEVLKTIADDPEQWGDCCSENMAERARAALAEYTANTPEKAFTGNKAQVTAEKQIECRATDCEPDSPHCMVLRMTHRCRKAE
jgi:hypothetical protein